MPNAVMGQVFITKTSDRTAGIRTLLSRFELGGFSGKRVALKANYNSADPFPASTHIETLSTLIKILKEANAKEIILAERSGMGDTRRVLEKMGVFELSKKLGFKVMVLDEAEEEDWVKLGGNGTHWKRGFYIARVFLEADKVVQTCCLKTHRFGGHFTLSLKNSVGLVANLVPNESHSYMKELHSSPFQRQMIAEINKFYDLDLVLMDGIRAFVDGGPEKGVEVVPDLLFASKDRVALDAVGVAVLRSYGKSDPTVLKGKIFELDQIHRAAMLEVGVKSALEIKLTPLDDGSFPVVEKLEHILQKEK
jgi:uncharacterized protein (DUF362 family)